ncbi:uncharacterized protein LOC117526377 [Thalassophryne amazonica]|uniref:uncharacterized protein LOC117526377 n=1 Tax=Thalassophryne amazonica TaxID=390379 RepID=UPI001470C3BF|nr:uncharacterized protein LOC117526377 [Thalassophryne amazonica]
MPQIDMNDVGKRRGSRWYTSRACGLVQHTALVNGILHYEDCPAVCNGICKNTAAGTPITSKPYDMVNGYVPAFRKITKVPPIKTHPDGRGTVSPVSKASSAKWVCAGISGVLMNRATSVNLVSLANGSYEVPPEISLSPVKRHKKRKKCRRKNSRTEVACPTSVHSLMLSEEQEDWDSEIQEVPLTDRGKICLGIKPYDAEDVISSALRGLNLNQKDSADVPVTARYIPAVHHPCPIRLSCYSTPTEPGQFADADE